MGFPLIVALSMAFAPARDVALTLDEALARSDAASAHAQIEERAERSAKSADEIPAGPGFNPTLAIQPGYRFAPEDSRAFEVQASLVQPISLEGVGALRREVHRARARQALAEVEAARRARRLETARAWVGASIAQASLERAEEDVALATSLLAQTRQLRSANDATELEVAEAEALLAEAELDLLAAEGELLDESFALAASTGLPPDQHVIAVGKRPTVPRGPRRPVSPWAAEALERHAEVVRAEAEEVGASKGWQLSVGIAAQRDAPSGFVGFGVIALTFPLFDHGETERLGAELDASAAEARAAELRRRAKVEWEQLEHETIHTASVVDKLERGVVPALERSVAARKRLLAAGEATVAEGVVAQRRLVAARRRSLEAQARASVAAFELGERARAAAVPGGAR